MSDDEDYEFDYSDEDDDMESADVDLHVQIENQYYAAKAFLEDEPPHKQEALAALLQVVEMQHDDKSDWGFKALKRIVKLHFEDRDHDRAIVKYEELLGHSF